ncbi:MAG: hypothetical protein M3R27_11335 [Bacteroidota bacterium]|nr:hypothetical protein [Bacteroidota bacterium]
MKNTYLFKLSLVLTSFCFAFSSCVRDIEDEIDIDAVTKVLIDGAYNYTLSANSAKTYKITFQIDNDDYGIENGKDVTFSVSKGKLVDPSNLSQEVTSLTVKVGNKIAEVYYKADHEASENIELIVTALPFKITKRIITLPVTPVSIQFDQNVYLINKAAPLDVITFLQASQGKVSSKLVVDFSYQVLGVNASVINLTPATTLTVQEEDELFTKASTQVKNLSQALDTILLFVNYQGVPFDTATVYFNE